MATIVEPIADGKASERKFYSRMAILLVAVVFIGFAPSFYLKGIVPAYPRPNPTLPPSVILHGTVFTLWMALLVTQTQLIAARKHQVHMRLGKLAMLLAILIIPVMYLAAVWQVARANQPPFTDPLTWTIVPLATIVPFAILVWQGWTHRRNAQWHKRAMLGAAIVVVAGPSIGRFPIFPPTLVGFTIIFFLEFLLFVPLIVWDRRTTGKIHPATKLGLSMLALVTFIPLLVFWTGADWASIARHLPGVNA
jgi:cytochrome bd-type quinol oxidase subunit 2